ncbi:M20/M25/M40 family metallo-hydrolase [Psychrobacter arenosus]|uniref:M20/M25/M40 family metallo-hydrolase n=1 Tax=Psychrobacter arenosus TaxID=256326 RepID=UPI001919A42A|nr:M20/M25/M40 family metallo-hydrolase [Psychrobacter arenosus]
MSLSHPLLYALPLSLLLSSCSLDSVKPDTSPSDSVAITSPIAIASTKQILSTLAADDMQGRQDGTVGGKKAAQYIEREFAAAGLSKWGGLSSYQQAYEIEGPEGPIATSNVIGFIAGKSRPDELVVFSAHYDHLGVEDSAEDTGKNKIYNGANDDASGVTALIQLAKYYQQRNDNERSIVFVAFSGEEAGGFGSQAFASSIDPDQVVAMFNIEMIGTPSKWGNDSAYITGYDKSDFGAILQKNLQGSNFKFHPDPYLDKDLFYRSDNATLAAQGVPAHTISTSKMDNEPYYHTVDDEIATLDIANMNAIIKAIALSATSIVNGDSTPTRIAKQ